MKNCEEEPSAIVRADFLLFCLSVEKSGAANHNGWRLPFFIPNIGGLELKILVFTIMLAALTAGMASAGYDYHGCANNNSRACTDARNAYASHHGGVFPEQYSQNHAHRHHHHWFRRNHHEHEMHEHQNEAHRENR
jgi:hypothetical protein